MRCLHKLSSSWTAAVMLTLRTVANCSACRIWLNTPWDPEISGTALRRRPISNYQFFLEQLWEYFGIAPSALLRFYFISWGRASTRLDVSMAQPSTVSVVLQLASTFLIFLIEIGSSQSLLVASFWRKRLSIFGTYVLSSVSTILGRPELFQ